MNRVLIVEDDLTIARIYQGLIRMEGCEPVVAGDGELAIQALSERRPDLVLLDLMLPKKNGIEVLKHIRSTPQLQKIPVVVFTNACMGTLVQEAMDAGANQCLIKAQTAPKQLMQALRAHLKAVIPVEPLSSPPPASALEPPPAVPSVLHEPVAQENPLEVLPSISLSAIASEPIVPVLPISAELPPSDSSSNLTSEAAAEEVFEQEGSLTEQENVRQQLLAEVPGMLRALRHELHSLAKKDDPDGQHPQLLNLCRSIQALTSSATLVNLTAIAQMSGALEALLGELHRHLDKLNSSTLRTAAQGLDCLDALFTLATQDRMEEGKAPLILILDDDAICRKLIGTALTRANLKALRLEDPALAMRVLKENAFDLVFLDVMMPGMDGFELCKKIRASDINKTTPVVFVTSLSSLDTRAQSILSGGNDFIGKPFLPTELIVKALVHVLMPRRPDRARGSKPVAATLNAQAPSGAIETINEVPCSNFARSV